MAEINLGKQVAGQCRVVAHLATVLAGMHTEYAKLVETPIFADCLDQVGQRSALLMELLGEALNGMDAASAEDDWTIPIFEEAQRLFPAPNQSEEAKAAEVGR